MNDKRKVNTMLLLKGLILLIIVLVVLVTFIIGIKNKNSENITEDNTEEEFTLIPLENFDKDESYIMPGVKADNVESNPSDYKEYQDDKINLTIPKQYNYIDYRQSDNFESWFFEDNKLTFYIGREKPEELSIRDTEKNLTMMANAYELLNFDYDNNIYEFYIVGTTGNRSYMAFIYNDEYTYSLRVDVKSDNDDIRNYYDAIKALNNLIIAKAGDVK